MEKLNTENSYIESLEAEIKLLKEERNAILEKFAKVYYKEVARIRASEYIAKNQQTK
jgi:ElaB/YqjD/DUF883 family membrane-anchored ribosome-binding protein